MSSIGNIDHVVVADPGFCVCLINSSVLPTFLNCIYEIEKVLVVGSLNPRNVGPVESGNIVKFA